MNNRLKVAISAIFSEEYRGGENIWREARHDRTYHKYTPLSKLEGWGIVPGDLLISQIKLFLALLRHFPIILASSIDRPADNKGCLHLCNPRGLF